MKTELQVEKARKIVTENDSPDIGFNRSINPYRGCEHGWIHPPVTHIGAKRGAYDVAGANQLRSAGLVSAVRHSYRRAVAGAARAATQALAATVAQAISTAVAAEAMKSHGGRLTL